MNWIDNRERRRTPRACQACGDEFDMDSPRSRSAFARRKAGQDIEPALLCWRCAHLHYAAIREAKADAHIEAEP
jgi:hypothetical protein